MEPLLNGIIRGIVDKQTWIYNPTFLYGSSTRVHEIVTVLIERYREKHPQAKINYITGQQFSALLIKSIKDNSYEKYVKSLIASDLFIFEGSEHLGGKMMPMKKFYSIFDKLWESGK